MIAEYYIYRLQGNNEPFVSLKEMPQFQIAAKRKYVGKKLKIEAVRRLLGQELEQTLTTPQVNDYIEMNIYGTEHWPEYRKIYSELSNEVQTEKQLYKLQYILVAEMEDFAEVGKEHRKERVNPADPRLIHLIRCELLGKPLEMYKTMINPIKSLRKQFL